MPLPAMNKANAHHWLEETATWESTEIWTQMIAIPDELQWTTQLQF